MLYFQAFQFHKHFNIVINHSLYGKMYSLLYRYYLPKESSSTKQKSSMYFHLGMLCD